MKLVVSSIALSLDDITETDGQKSGVFHPIDRNKVDGDVQLPLNRTGNDTMNNLQFNSETYFSL